MWDDLVRGAIGAVVLVDTSRLADCFPAVDYMETQGVPFIVAVNLFHGKQYHSLDDVREALGVPDDVPMITTDARDRARPRWRCSSSCSTRWCGPPPARPDRPAPPVARRTAPTGRPRDPSGERRSAFRRSARLSGRPAPVSVTRCLAAPVTVVLVHWNQPERCARTIEAFQHQGVPVADRWWSTTGPTPAELGRLRRRRRDSRPRTSSCSSWARTPGSARRPTSGSGAVPRPTGRRASGSRWRPTTPCRPTARWPRSIDGGRGAAPRRAGLRRRGRRRDAGVRPLLRRA